MGPLAAALQLLDAQATEKGVWHAVDARWRTSDAALQSARARYLEQQCVLEAAEAVSSEAEALLAGLGITQRLGGGGGGEAASSHGGSGDGDGADGGSSGGAGAADDAAAHAALRAAGLGCGVSTYHSLSRHLQAARAAQRLALPDVQAPGAGSARKGVAPGGKTGDQQQQQQQQQDTDPQRDGSLQHLLGVTPEELRQAHCLPRAAAQRTHAGVAREVEARLVELADEMAAAVLGDDAAGDAAAAAQAAQAARDAVAAAGAAAAEADRLLRRHVALCGDYLGVLSSIHSVLSELVEGCLLGKQARMDETHCRWLISHVRTLRSKLCVLQAQLQVATYTSESVPALRAIAAAIGGEEAAARAAVERVSAQLLAYSECGPEFADVVWQYAEVKEELRRVEHALHHFSQLELEMELTGA